MSPSLRRLFDDAFISMKEFTVALASEPHNFARFRGSEQNRQIFTLVPPHVPRVRVYPLLTISKPYDRGFLPPAGHRVPALLLDPTNDSDGRIQIPDRDDDCTRCTLIFSMRANAGWLICQPEQWHTMLVVLSTQQFGKRMMCPQSEPIVSTLIIATCFRGEPADAIIQQPVDVHTS